LRVLRHGDGSTIVRAGTTELLETQTTRVTELDPFFSSCSRLLPVPRDDALNVSHVFTIT
jgi:hypothetical protein